MLPGYQQKSVGLQLKFSPIIRVATFTGIGGRFQMEWVATLKWNRWQVCSGIRNFNQLLVLCETRGDEMLKAKALASTGVAHYDLTDYPQAVRFLQQALELQVNHGNIPERVHVLMHLWKSFDHLDQKDKASKHKQEFETLSRKINPQENGEV